MLHESNSPHSRRLLHNLQRTLPNVNFQLASHNIIQKAAPISQIITHSTTGTSTTISVIVHRRSKQSRSLHLLILASFRHTNTQAPRNLNTILTTRRNSTHKILHRLLTRPAITTLRPIVIAKQAITYKPTATSRLLE